jgi:hypothetical protein
MDLTPAAGNTYFVNGASGNDGNPGTEAAPWKTVEHATKRAKAGDQVVMAAGIYRVEALHFGPAGGGPEKMTVYRAAPGARVVFSKPDDKAPGVGLDNYVRLQGLWFGGSGMKAGEIVGTGGSPVSRGKELIDCTIFGYKGGLVIGSAEDLLVHGCRFVHCGEGQFGHGIYLCGGYNKGQMSTHVIVDYNVFVAGTTRGLGTMTITSSFSVAR